MTVVALRRVGCYKCCRYSCSFAKTEISFATFLLTSKDGTSEPLPLTSDRHGDPLNYLTDDTAVTLLNEVPEDSRVVHYHMTDYVGAFHYSDGKPIDCIAVLSVCPLIEAASLLHPLFAVNLCGRGQFTIDLLAHLGFKRMVSCSFRDKRLKTRAYGIIIIISSSSLY